MARIEVNNETLNKLSVELHGYIQNDNLSQAKQLLRTLQISVKRAVVVRPIYGCSALFSVADHNRVSWISFLINDCGANVDQKDVATFPEGDSHLVRKMNKYILHN